MLDPQNTGREDVEADKRAVAFSCCDDNFLVYAKQSLFAQAAAGSGLNARLLPTHYRTNLFYGEEKISYQLL